MTSENPPADPGDAKHSPTARALGKVASGIYILTARHGDQETGMLASWVQQAAFEPMMVSVAVRRDRYVCDWLRAGAAVAINVVGEGQKWAVSHFVRGFEPSQAAFDGITVQRRQTGAAILSDGLAYLEGKVASQVEAGDHRLFVIEILGGAILHDGRPMTHVRGTGLHY